MTAVSLWDGLPMEDALIPPDPGLTLEERFWQFHTRNPQVYAALRRLALDLANRGKTRIGVKGLVEVLRWHHQLVTDDPTSDYQINNSYTAFYARLLVANEPALADRIELRAQRAA